MQTEQQFNVLTCACRHKSMGSGHIAGTCEQCVMCDVSCQTGQHSLPHARPFHEVTHIGDLLLHAYRMQSISTQSKLSQDMAALMWHCNP